MPTRQRPASRARCRFWRSQRGQLRAATRTARTPACGRSLRSPRSASSRADLGACGAADGRRRSRPRIAVSGGSHSANRVSPRSASRVLGHRDARPPARRSAGCHDAPGAALVAEASTKTGSLPYRRRAGAVGARCATLDPEHAAVGVALVNHDVAQPAQVQGPPRVLRQHGAVQHVRVGEHPVRVRSNPVALGESACRRRRWPAARPEARVRQPAAAGRRPAPWSATGRAPVRGRR